MAQIIREIQDVKERSRCPHTSTGHLFSFRRLSFEKVQQWFVMEKL